MTLDQVFACAGPARAAWAARCLDLLILVVILMPAVSCHLYPRPWGDFCLPRLSLYRAMMPVPGYGTANISVSTFYPSCVLSPDTNNAH